MTAALIKERYYILTRCRFSWGAGADRHPVAGGSQLPEQHRQDGGGLRSHAGAPSTPPPCSRTWRRTTAASLACWRRPWTNRPSLPGHRPSIPSGPIAHQFKYDAHFLFSTTRTHRLDGYPDWQQPEGYRAQARPWYQTPVRRGDDLVWFGPLPGVRFGRQVLTLIKRVKDDEATAWTADGGHVVQRLAGRCTGRWGEDRWPLHHRRKGRVVVGHNLSLLPPQAGDAGGRPGRVLGRSPPATRSGGWVGSQRLSPPPIFMKTCKTPC